MTQELKEKMQKQANDEFSRMLKSTSRGAFQAGAEAMYSELAPLVRRYEENLEDEREIVTHWKKIEL